MSAVREVGFLGQLVVDLSDCAIAGLDRQLTLPQLFHPTLPDPRPSLVFGFGMSAFMLGKQVLEQINFCDEQRKSIELSPRIPTCGQMLSA